MSVIKSLDFVVAGRYRLVRKIGSGSFGDIYLGINVSNGEVSYEILFMYFILSFNFFHRNFAQYCPNFFSPLLPYAPKVLLHNVLM